MKLWHYSLSLITSFIMIHPIAASTIKEEGGVDKKRVVSVFVAPLPGDFSKAKIIFSNNYKIKVGQQGGLKSLDPIIELPSTSSHLKLTIWFNVDQESKEASKIFSDIIEDGDYQLQISFENYDPANPWKLTIRNRKITEVSQ